MSLPPWESLRQLVEGSASLGASPKFALATFSALPVGVTVPFTWKTLFAALYPTSAHIVEAELVSRCIVAIAAGSGVVLLDEEGEQVPWSFVAGEANSIRTRGVHNAGTLTAIKVLL